MTVFKKVMAGNMLLMSYMMSPLTNPSVLPPSEYRHFAAVSPSYAEVMQMQKCVVLHLARLFWDLGCCLETPGVVLE